LEAFGDIALAKRQIENKPPLSPPDGSRYTGWETWKNHRWAWEFLRRNDEFVEACDRVADGKDNAKAVAKRFHLRRFKRYDEPYEIIDARNQKVKPAFISSSVSGIQVPVNENELQEARRSIRRLTLDIGQVVVRFDLSVAMEYPKRLDGQIVSVTGALKKQLERLQNAMGVDAKDSRNKSNASRLLHLLKVLDMQKVDGTNVQRGDALFGKADNASEAYDGDLKAARQFTNEDFLKLAAAGTALPPKGNEKT
jgi:hypothetical protein